MIPTSVNKTPIALALAVIMAPTHAQDGVGSSARMLEEVIVTAQKREQGQQDVPIAVAAFTGEMVEKAGAFNITGINGIKPNIILQTEGLVPNVPMFSIRGMNHSDPDPNSDPKISTVIDGVYTPFVAGALLDLFDIERVEVLRGPQGTLFGKNNLAGTVNVVSS
ncbi:MAG: TonB-dependent receptor plug domain-containing protein, partial [Pseudomonadales bacterium]